MCVCVCACVCAFVGVWCFPALYISGGQGEAEKSLKTRFEVGLKVLNMRK